jgi:hypothetical protein
MIRDNRFASVTTGTLSTFLLPSVSNIVFVSVLFVLVFGVGNGLLGDGDTGYHIKTGELILQSWHVPAHDPYSLHSPPLKWTAHEWLSEVVMALLFKAFGLTGVVIFFAILLAITHWLLYHVLRNQSDDILLCTITAILATATSSTHWLARPHVFSLLLTILWCYYLNRFQYRDEKTLAYLPLLMFFWVNLHGGFIIGLILVTIYLLGNILFAFTGRRELSQQYQEKAKSLLLVGAASTAVCLINPQGFEILLFPLRITSDRFVMDRVTEFLSPNFHDALPFKYMLLTLIGALALSRTALGVIDLAIVVLLSYMALYSARHVSLFAIVLAPILLKTMAGILARAPETFLKFCQIRNRNLNAIDAHISGYLWPMLSTVLVVVLAGTGMVKYHFDNKKFPAAAVEFLKREPIVGNMFNDDEFGDYMIFTAWPEYRVFMDGRSDMYGRKFGGDYLRVANVQPGWKEILKKYNISWVIFDTDSALTAALQDQSDWRTIYSDRVATIFVKRDAPHAALLDKYSAVRPAFGQ